MEEASTSNNMDAVTSQQSEEATLVQAAISEQRHSAPPSQPAPPPASPPHRTRSKSGASNSNNSSPNNNNKNFVVAVPATQHHSRVSSSSSSNFTPSSAPAQPIQMVKPPTTATASPPAETPAATKQEEDQEMADNSPQAPPTPDPTSPSHTAVPSFISTDPMSDDDPNSSSSEDSDGASKPPRPPRFDSKGLRRPTPSYYYDADYDPANVGSKKKRRRGGMKGIPVFEPTMEEFEGQGGFYGYVKRIEKYGMRSGVVKVVPPKEWSAQLPSTAPPLKATRLREPIEQHMVGSQGLYRVTNVAKTRIWNPAQWKEAAESSKWAAPDFKEEKPDRSERTTKVPMRKPMTEEVKAERAEKAERERLRKLEAEENGETLPTTKGVKRKGRGGRRGGKRSNVKGKVKAMEAEAEGDGTEADGEEEEGDDSNLKEEDVVMADAVQALPSPAPSGSNIEGTTPANASGSNTPPPQSLADSPVSTPQPDTTTSKATSNSTAKKRRPTNLQRAEPTEEEWEAFVKTFEELPHGMKKEDYTVELLREVERRYWRTLTFGEPPMYGADMKGSLFDDSTKAWNVASLGDLLPRLAPASCRIPGVVSPYLYFGMWRATFAWHVEDADLYSINYIHFGAPKFWYSVPQEQSERFERIMEGFFPTDRSKCSQFLRHKAFLASPRVLANSGITLNRCVQLPGEFILTYPKGYHSGFNLGFNAAESINFATERWLPLGKLAKACECIGDSVNIDVEAWLHEAAVAEGVIKGEILSQLPSASISSSAPRRKRMAVIMPPSKESTPSKKVKLDESFPTLTAPATIAPAPVRELSKKAKAELDKVAKEESFVCALCPDMSTEGLVTIGEPGVKSRKVLSAHRVCVIFTPATWIDTDPDTGDEIVRGYARIEKARWKLKCQLCAEKHGTKVQCTKGKCPKAFHVTCALREDTGVFLDATVAEDGAQVSILEQAKKEIDAEKSGSPKLASKVVIPHRSVPDSAPAPTPPTVLDPGHVPSETTSTNALPSTAGPVAPTQPTPSESKTSAPVTFQALLSASDSHTASAEVADDGGIKLTVLCKLHNPAWQKMENDRKAAELKARVDKIPLNSRIHVRTSGGMFEVTHSAVLDVREAIQVIFDDGKRSDVKWRNIVWPEIVEALRKKEEVAAAERARQENVYVWDHGPIQPTKRSSFLGNPVAPYPYPYPPPPPSYYTQPNMHPSHSSAPPHLHPAYAGAYPSQPPPTSHGYYPHYPYPAYGAPHPQYNTNVAPSASHPQLPPPPQGHPAPPHAYWQQYGGAHAYPVPPPGTVPPRGAVASQWTASGPGSAGASYRPAPMAPVVRPGYGSPYAYHQLIPATRTPSHAYPSGGAHHFQAPVASAGQQDSSISNNDPPGTVVKEKDGETPTASSTSQPVPVVQAS
ncbi:hypothetical protein T439DRAFT_328987 [Meredithblackwellia eburnea MCA 4105]